MIENYKCPLCYRIFTTEIDFKVHVYTHRLSCSNGFNESLIDPDNDPYYKKRQYAYKIINSALLQYDLKKLTRKYKIEHKSVNCIKEKYVVVACVYSYNFNLKYFEIHLSLDKPNYCIKHNAIHEVAHVIEKTMKGVTYDSTILGHSKLFYDICFSIDPNFNKCNPCNLCMQILRLLVCNKLLKDNYKIGERKSG